MLKLTQASVLNYLKILRQTGKEPFKIGHTSNNCNGTLIMLKNIKPIQTMDDKEWGQVNIACENCFKSWLVEKLSTMSDNDLNLRFGMKTGLQKEGSFSMIFKNGHFSLKKDLKVLGAEPGDHREIEKVAGKIHSLEELWKIS